jgi:broad-specificity NMP kinase
MEIMKPKLIFIGGPPGVGKTSVANELCLRLRNSVWIEGDDLWRMNPFTVNERTVLMVERNVGCVLRSFLETGFSYIVLTWVLHRNEIIQSLLDHISSHEFDFHHFTLICDEDELKARLAEDANRITDPHLALNRLEQARQVTSDHIDTNCKNPQEVAARLYTLISE